MSRSISIFSLALVFMLFSRAVPADDGSISIRLTDDKGRSLNGTVQVTGPAKKSCTTASGRCTLSSLKPGKYTVTVTLTDKSKLANKTITVSGGKTATLAFQAVPAPVKKDEGTKSKEEPTGAKGATSSKGKLPDMGTGKKLCVSGRVTDSQGRSINGSVLIIKDGVTIGTAATQNGRFSIYDLGKGKYEFTFQAADKSKATKTSDYADKALTLTLIAQPAK